MYNLIRASSRLRRCGGAAAALRAPRLQPHLGGFIPLGDENLERRVGGHSAGGLTYNHPRFRNAMGCSAGGLPYPAPYARIKPSYMNKHDAKPHPPFATPCLAMKCVCNHPDTHMLAL